MPGRFPNHAVMNYTSPRTGRQALIISAVVAFHVAVIFCRGRMARHWSAQHFCGRDQGDDREGHARRRRGSEQAFDQAGNEGAFAVEDGAEHGHALAMQQTQRPLSLRLPGAAGAQHEHHAIEAAAEQAAVRVGAAAAPGRTPARRRSRTRPTWFAAAGRPGRAAGLPAGAVEAGSIARVPEPRAARSASSSEAAPASTSDRPGPSPS